MKPCSVCEKDLPAQIDEYGDMFYPMCRTCFLSGYQPIVYIDEKIEELEEYIRQSVDDMAGIENDREETQWEAGRAEKHLRELQKDERKNEDEITTLKEFLAGCEESVDLLYDEISGYEAAVARTKEELAALVELKNKILSVGKSTNVENQLEFAV